MRARDYSGPEVTYLDYEAKVYETDQAALYRFLDYDKDKWVPKSMIKCDSDDILGVPTWWAKKQKLV